MLKLENIDVRYGPIQALHGMTLEVRRGEIVALIGANGAGKTTTLRTVSGLLTPANKDGRITFKDQCLYGIPSGGKKPVSMAPHQIVALGLSHVPEGRRVFPEMSVHENLLMGAYSRKHKIDPASYDRVFAHFPRLKERIRQLAGTLSGGEQQMLAMGRALMAAPELLLLDEPSMGLAPMLVEEIFHIIEDINAAGTTILLVEQNAHLALEISHRAYVLETGTVVDSFVIESAADLIKNEAIHKAYLGY